MAALKDFLTFPDSRKVEGIGYMYTVESFFGGLNLTGVEAVLIVFTFG